MSQESNLGDFGGILPQFRSIMLVAVGSNRPSAEGDARETISRSISELSRAGGVIRSVSGFYRSPAFPAGSGPDYVNAAIALEAAWTENEALAHMHAIEARLGRSRAERWGAREIDLDLVAAGSAVQPDIATVRLWMDLPFDEQRKKAPGQLILPHPRMHERAFVLVPLADIAPGWVHPITGHTVLEMRDSLPAADLAQVIELHKDTD